MAIQTYIPFTVRFDAIKEKKWIANNWLKTSQSGLQHTSKALMVTDLNTN